MYLVIDKRPEILSNYLLLRAAHISLLNSKSHGHFSSPTYYIYIAHITMLL